ncbi:response regulator transcription factor [Novosphingobium sp. B 225]|uniref:response regulator transcription factor n=1 Tax=Novosphingobium sp. B 225 TaxID=1961849 RepID=UPI000B4BAB6B|nr:response regulator transcription factor [Novosphingobium sp. B 225]
MVRLILIYGGALAALALLVEWMDFRHQSRAWSTSLYVLCVALLFAGLGIWLGNRLTPRARTGPFQRNRAALTSLGISPRECDVLDLLAAGHSNKVIARRLAISPNTVKTHLARLFEKLEAQSRTQAIAKARSLDLVP